MKNFAIFLLLTNILWWGWQLVYPQGNPKLPNPTSDQFFFEQGAKKLQLLSEIKPQEAETLLAVQSEQIVEQSPQMGGKSESAAPILSDKVPDKVASKVQLLSWCGESVSAVSTAEAAKFLDKWRQLQGSGEQNMVQEPVSSTWWVHLSPFKDEAEANKKMLELKEKKIDSYYMRTGEMAGGISLGVFSRKQSATAVQAELAKKGYRTELKEVFRMESRTRLDLKLDDRSRWESRDVRELLAGFQRLGVQEIPCK